MTSNVVTSRLAPKKQTIEDAYSPPANFLEIDLSNPQTLGVGKTRYTTYEVRMNTNLPVFKQKETSVRRRYSDFEWLRSELERDSKIVVPKLPSKAWKRQLPFRGDEGIFEEDFIEDRRKGLEEFINKIAGHPLAQNEKCLHMFLQDECIDRNYTPDKMVSEVGCTTPVPSLPKVKFHQNQVVNANNNVKPRITSDNLDFDSFVTTFTSHVVADEIAEIISQMEELMLGAEPDVRICLIHCIARSIWLEDFNSFFSLITSPSFAEILGSGTINRIAKSFRQQNSQQTKEVLKTKCGLQVKYTKTVPPTVEEASQYVNAPVKTPTIPAAKEESPKSSPRKAKSPKTKKTTPKPKKRRSPKKGVESERESGQIIKHKLRERSKIPQLSRELSHSPKGSSNGRSQVRERGSDADRPASARQRGLHRTRKMRQRPLAVSGGEIYLALSAPIVGLGGRVARVVSPADARRGAKVFDPGGNGEDTLDIGARFLRSAHTAWRRAEQDHQRFDSDTLRSSWRGLLW